MWSTTLGVLGLALCGYVCLLALGDVALVIVHLRCRDRQIAAERRAIAAPAGGATALSAYNFRCSTKRS